MTSMRTTGERAEQNRLDDAVNEPGLDSARVPPGGLRDRLRTNRATRQPYRIGVFVLGLLCIGAGVALAVLPGPLTIPPVLLGLWIWSWEFRFAQELFEKFSEKGQDAWKAAKERPVVSAFVTGFGLIAAGAAMWAVVNYDLVARGKDAIGL